MRDRDLGGYVNEAREAVARSVSFPPGYYAIWSGQFEYFERAQKRLQIVVPATLLLIFLLLYLNFRRLTETLIVMLSLPFSLVGGLWLMDFLGFNLSVAAAVGFIALAGVAAETGVVMLIYLDHAYRDRLAACQRDGQPFGRRELYEAIMAGAVDRVRPKMMTVVAIMAGLLPILWSTGTGSEVMRRIAVPMIGGMVSSTVLTLIVIPAIYALVKGAALRQASRRTRSANPHRWAEHNRSRAMQGMMDHSMDGMGWMMMGGMGLIGLLLLILLVLGIAALITSDRTYRHIGA